MSCLPTWLGAPLALNLRAVVLLAMVFCLDLQQRASASQSSCPPPTHTQRDNGTLIVFLGNEGTLGIPKQPIVFENAERMQALVILVEHR
jgi:hypothetical protein